MKRILIIGSGGSGKTRLSLRLGKMLELPVIHLDALFWNPGWIKTPREEWFQKVRELLDKEKWILDGNFGSTLEMRLEACDTAIFLDFPRTLCLYRALKRQVMNFNKVRPDMGKGCPEHIDWEFAKWIWNFPKADKARILKILDKFKDDKSIIILKSDRDIKDLLSSMKNPEQRCSKKEIKK